MCCNSLLETSQGHAEGGAEGGKNYWLREQKVEVSLRRHYQGNYFDNGVVSSRLFC